MSDFLFARPDTFDGIMSIIDLFGCMREYNYSNTPEGADRRAFRSDMDAIKSDFNSAYKQTINVYAK